MIRQIGRRYRLFGRSLRSRLMRWLVGGRAIGVLYDADNGRFLVTPEDNSVLAKRLGRKGMYGAGSLEALEPHLTPESRVLFVGAHVGTLLIPVAARVRHVVGIEANPRTYQLLRLNLLLNGVSNAEVHHFAAGDAEREVEFLLSTSNSGGSKIKPEKGYYPFLYDRPQVVRVPMRRLDDALPGEAFDVIVMDVEGAETIALRGMPAKLAACRVLHIEYIQEHLERVAGVELGTFLGAFAGHFDRGFIIGDPSGRVYGREDFAEMLGGVTNCDAVFLRDAAPAAAGAAAAHASARG